MRAVQRNALYYRNACYSATHTALFAALHRVQRNSVRVISLIPPHRASLIAHIAASQHYKPITIKTDDFDVKLFSLF
jgi:hypothetical protein